MKIFRLDFPDFNLTQKPDLPDGTVSSFVTPPHHQLVVANLRHGEVHEVPAGDVDLAVDVARLSEHDLRQKIYIKILIISFF